MMKADLFKQWSVTETRPWVKYKHQLNKGIKQSPTLHGHSARAPPSRARSRHCRRLQPPELLFTLASGSPYSPLAPPLPSCASRFKAQLCCKYVHAGWMMRVCWLEWKCVMHVSPGWNGCVCYYNTASWLASRSRCSCGICSQTNTPLMNLHQWNNTNYDWTNLGQVKSWGKPQLVSFSSEYLHRIQHLTTQKTKRIKTLKRDQM